MYLSRMAEELKIDDVTALRLLIKIWKEKAKEGGDNLCQK